MKIILTGANGQVGFELQRSLACLGEVYATDRTQLDLTNEKQIRSTISDIKPDLIVNAAAYTAVDKAEQESEMAMLINARAPAVMAEECHKLAIPIIHYSTDYVFNGDNDEPWTEHDEPSPINVYGSSKLEGERAIVAAGANHLIFRTSWVYGARGHNFMLTMQRLAAQREQLSVVSDQIGAPTWSRHIADITAQIVAQALGSEDSAYFWKLNSGLYHLSAAGQTSWFGFAEQIMQLLKQQGQTVPVLQPIKSDDYPTPAKRPSYSCLNNQKIFDNFGLVLPDWLHSLQLVMKEAD